MQSSKEDIANMRMMKVVLDEAKFEVKGDAILSIARLLLWHKDLEDRMVKSLTVETLAGGTIKKIPKNKLKKAVKND